MDSNRDQKRRMQIEGAGVHLPGEQETNFKHMHTISKHQRSACQAKLLGLTLKYSIFTLFSVTKVIISPLPFIVPSFQTLRSFSDLFSVVILERNVIWMSKSLIFLPLFLTPWNNFKVSKRSTRTEYSGWCFLSFMVFLHYLSVTEACKSRAAIITMPLIESCT